ncbi:hypothetical protein GCM10020221_09610 [Streptomyces thioluteus]|uniref:Uncharacterized protein n=1 Tax=Streptomyces thioluteus TaxID=66431 RepID=A0ABN3WJD4_STRTU
MVARGAEPVEQVQQGVPGGQRRLVVALAPQVHHARAPELVAQLVGGAQREGGAARARRAVQHHDHRLGLRARPGLVHPLGDPVELLLAAGERALDGRQIVE